MLFRSERGREGYNICIYIYRERGQKGRKKERKGSLKRIEKREDYSTIISYSKVTFKLFASEGKNLTKKTIGVKERKQMTDRYGKIV